MTTLLRLILVLAVAVQPLSAMLSGIASCDADAAASMPKPVAMDSSCCCAAGAATCSATVEPTACGCAEPAEFPPAQPAPESNPDQVRLVGLLAPRLVAVERSQPRLNLSARPGVNRPAQPSANERCSFLCTWRT